MARVNAEPIVVLTARGKVHKAMRDFRGKVVGHPRCRLSASTPRILGGSAAAFDYELLRHPYVYCRYRWCFRDLLIEMGIDPFVGHAQREHRWRPA
jgi:hypothetical protein